MVDRQVTKPSHLPPRDFRELVTRSSGDRLRGFPDNFKVADYGVLDYLRRGKSVPTFGCRTLNPVDPLDDIGEAR